ncbi:hypothetical protein FB476_3148 [Ornithinimicrobium humiphilum]|uniref:ScyD/ScyE family protein n=1 Tax=Ornithinimicrobium humiphilum TaxID=125288 RepID=A0A543K6V4_9MICO|nr:ScyD/ScyE family protein [Ornithinimicrobium humiphilum]TQM90764.1 hypothetical protein FB476_3148 [Ornithinimicrobium humiphilum]
MPTTRTRSLLALALAGLITATALPGAVAGEGKGTGKGRGRDDGGGTVTVVASGLDSPRHLTVTSRGDVYVAESGTGGDDCVLGVAPGAPDPVPVCAGPSGAVTKIGRDGGQGRVVTGLPSLAVGAEASGPYDVEVTGSSKLVVTFGLGNPPATRDALVAEHGRDYRRLATVQEIRLRGKGAPRFETEADLARHETRRNPDGGLLDTNSVSLARDRGGWLVADAGANAVLRVDDDRVRTLAVLAGGTTEFPPGSGNPFPFQPVPTSAVRGPDGAVYVSQLTGFPFPQGGAAIWRIGRDGTPRVWASGLTNVTDLAFDAKGALYAVQISDVGLAAETGLPSGSLVKVRRGSSTHTTVLDDLPAPFGVALSKDAAYVTTCAVCAGGGTVVRVGLGR